MYVKTGSSGFGGPSDCSADQRWDTLLNMCVPSWLPSGGGGGGGTTPSQTCATPGWVPLGPGGTCVHPLTLVPCPNKDEYRDANGNCVNLNLPGPTPGGGGGGSQPSVPGECPADEVWNGTSCIKVVPGDVQCKEGEVLGPDGKCAAAAKEGWWAARSSTEKALMIGGGAVLGVALLMALTGSKKAATPNRRKRGRGHARVPSRLLLAATRGRR